MSAAATNNLTGLGAYRYTSLLGFNGILATYKAFDNELNLTSSVVVVHESQLATPGVWDQSAAEIHQLLTAGASRVCQPTAYGSHDGYRWVAYEWQKGSHLGIRVRDGGLPARDEAFRWIGQTADALATLHRQGSSHRILSPASIFINDFGQAKLLHAGWGRVVRAIDGGLLNPNLMCILPFAAPEVAAGEAGDDAADVFSLGSNLYFLLTGMPAFWHEDPATLAALIAKGEVDFSPLRGELPPEALAALEEMLTRDPADRQVNLPALTDRLLAIADSLQPVPDQQAPAQPEVRIIEERISAAAVKKPKADGEESSSKISAIVLERQREVQQRQRESSMAVSKTVTVLAEAAETSKAKRKRTLIMAAAAAVLIFAVVVGGGTVVMGLFSGDDSDTLAPKPKPTPTSTANGAAPVVVDIHTKYDQTAERLRQLGQLSKGYQRTNGRWAAKVEDLQSVGAKPSEFLDSWDKAIDLRNEFVISAGADGKLDTDDDPWYDADAGTPGGYVPPAK